MPNGRYAARTTVPSDTSRAAIERLLIDHGAQAFVGGWDADGARIGFELAGRRILFRLPLPNRNAREFTHTPTRNQLRSPADTAKEYEQAVRQRWRALHLIIRAKIEAVEAGVTTVEQEFLPHILLPDGTTVGDNTLPAVAWAYDTGRVPRLLPKSLGMGEDCPAEVER